MFAPADYDLRPLTANDEPVLWEMLYTGLRPTGGEEPPREILRRPEYAGYVEGWGRPGDVGFIAHDKGQELPLGAVWFREPLENEDAPELAFVVKPAIASIDSALTSHPDDAGQSATSAIAMRMGANSPAVRLFGRFGFEIASQGDQFTVMRRAI